MPTPMTSPVERISGPSAGSTPGNLLNGKHRALDEDLAAPGERRGVSVMSFSFLPSISWTASLGSGTPVALLTYGTVREARGLTSMT